MRHILFIILNFLIILPINSQVTFVVNELPDNHDHESSIYISGDFEGWTGGIETYKLKKSETTYSITIPIDETVLYKFTLGNWQTVERDANGAQIDNRIYKYTKAKDTVYIKIASWQGADLANASTAAKNVSVISETFKMPQLDRERRVWVYVPPGYKNSKENYPVLYMHDGQNLFDASTSYSGEWEIDETLNRLFSLHNFKLIVVGIDNGGDKRLDEYSPWKHPKHGGGEGAAYMEFIVNTLKPHIDKNYKTLPDRNNTGIMGSSMGGLISHYAALKYPEVFGKAGVYSPAFWFAPEVTQFSKTFGNLKHTQLYYLAGGKEGGNSSFEGISQTANDMNSMVALLKKQGFSANNITSKVEPEGAHNEALWRTNFEETISWLFPEAYQPIRTFVKASQDVKNQINVEVSDGKYHIKFFKEDIVETTFIPKGEVFKKASHAVVLDPEAISTTFLETASRVSLASNGLEVRIQKEPFKVSYLRNGKEITSENNGYRRIDDLETIQFNLTKDAVLYGGGARALSMNRRGNRLRLYNKAHYGYEEESELMNYTMPIVLSSRQYMLHFDNAPIGYLDLDSKQDNTLTYETISGRKTYQLIVGDSWYDLIDNYTELTGKQPMPPRWALGNFASRFGYHSEKETRETITKFREEKIPLDAVIIDIYWFGKRIKGSMGNLEWLLDSFPTPQKMIKDFKDNAIKTILVTEPFILSTSSKWDEAVKASILAKDTLGNPARYDFYFGNTGLIDVYNPKGKKWFWSIYKNLANQGVAGIWGDLGEPEVHPTWVRHHTGTADEVHNTYGHDWARLVYEGYQRDFPDQRPFILMRAGFSGSQRYGMIPWSGDVNRSWGGLQSQPAIALQMGMQGLGYMHSDLGGFAGANLDDELYTRWLQYGVFQPIYRPHAQEEVAPEPVYRSDKAKALAKQAIELRYQLLPYNYNLVFQNHSKGTPLMRPLFFEDSTKRLTIEASSYLWGQDILVAPILKAGVKKKEVVFPKGNKWFDFYTDEIIAGGQTKTVKVNENTIPTYTRAGAFIPMTSIVQSTEDYIGNDLIIHYYHDASVTKSQRKWYNDDGKTARAFEKGNFELLEFEVQQKGSSLRFEFEKEAGKMSSKKTIQLIIHGVSKKPKRVKSNIKKSPFIWDSKNETLKVTVNWNTKSTMNLNVKF